MSLLARSRAVVARITQDTKGFASPVKLTNPAGQFATVHALTSEIWQGLDPNSGNIVNGAVSSLAIAIEALTKAGLGIPTYDHNRKAKPWLVDITFADGVVRQYVLVESRRDMTMGLIWYVLNRYQT